MTGPSFTFFMAVFKQMWQSLRETIVYYEVVFAGNEVNFGFWQKQHKPSHVIVECCKFGPAAQNAVTWPGEIGADVGTGF